MNANKGNENREPCVVCFKPVDIYSIGECDHAVCFECSTRMRVLCLQNECPICRHQLLKVIFTPECLPFKEINVQIFNNHFFDRKYKIAFVNFETKQSYLKLLENNCKNCDKGTGLFRDFPSLEKHMSSEHDLYFCDLCVNNLKIFTSERKCYTKVQLSLHKRKGDPDDSSLKGHPLCEFCKVRYMDTDELYRHLRKHHLYCHLCDADGFDHYYESYDCLREHFRKEHYLCEEGECIEQTLTAVFRTDIDLIAHKASRHGRGLSKQAARQARTLELQFTLTPRPPRPQRGPIPPHIRAENEEEIIQECVREESTNTTNITIDTGSTEQFPSLGNSSINPVITMNRAPAMVIRQSAGALARTDENFPALGGNSSNSTASTLKVNITSQPTSSGPSNAIIKSSANTFSANVGSKPSVSIHVHNRPTNASQFKLEPTIKQTSVRPEKTNDDIKRFEEEFPCLNKKDKNLLLNGYTSLLQTNTAVKKMQNGNVTTIAPSLAKPPQMSSHISYNTTPPQLSSSAFPALCPSTSSVLKQPQWIVSAKPKDKPKQTKVAPAPQIPIMSDINSSADFPSLATNRNKGKKNNKTELNNNQIDENNKSDNKKEKKKSKDDSAKVVTSQEKIKKNVPPDNLSEKNNKSNYQKGEIVGKKKSDEEFTWVEWKGKKNNLSNVNINDEPVKNVQSTEKTVKKKTTPNLSQDFPALDGGKKIPGFKNMQNENNNCISYSDIKNKLSYSENLKNRTSNSKNNTNSTLSEDVNYKSSFNEVINTPTPTSVFQNSLPPCNGLTFTSSSGQNYDIPIHNYLEPPNFTQRNKALVIKLMSELSSEDSIQEFKEISHHFREGIYSAESYYEQCQKYIGNEFDTLFPELLALLPDISKQQELHKIYNELAVSNLKICSSCGQVLIAEDFVSHLSSHNLLMHFPALGSPIQSTPSWRK